MIPEDENIIKLLTECFSNVNLIIFSLLKSTENMLVKVISAAIQGICAVPVQIEIHVSRGVRFSLVGLPDNAVRESHERIMSALQFNGMDMPRKQIVINMAPADLRKEGSGYDLALSVGLMAADGYVPVEALDDAVFIGELSLDGHILPVRGALSIAMMAKELGIKRIYVPTENGMEASVVDSLDVYAVNDLQELVGFMNGKIELSRVNPPEEILSSDAANEADFADVKGQMAVKRAIEVACSGGHNLIMIGPPGAGKTMMAKCIPSILPPMTKEEALLTTKIHSIAGKISAGYGLVNTRPFRSPHHTISSVAMIGGGSHPQPGEISLANSGVLFLDEFPEFQRNVLEVLRQPLEDRKIRIARAAYTVEYPADFMLVASMNPCPCGYYNHPTKACVCSPSQVQRYMNRISGPLLDRIDIQIQIIPVSLEQLQIIQVSESSSTIRKRVMAARQIQAERYKDCKDIFCNAQMNSRQLSQYARPDKEGASILKMAMEKLQLSARAYSRILKVARTIADMEASENIRAKDIAEAVQYRSLDRGNWGGM